MKLNISYDEEFTKFFDKLRSKYGEKIFEIEGLNGQLDINAFSKALYSKKTVADNSVDSNANVTDFTPATYINEITKPFLKLNSFYLLWKQLRCLYNNTIAEDILEKQINGTIYINDFHGFAGKLSYCFNFSCLDIVNKGLPFISKIRTVPPKHLYSFKSQLEQFIVYASNNIMGATGIADLFVILGWYMDKILETKSDGHFNFKATKDCWTYLEETLASLIYTLNQPFRGSIQSAFTNVSIYDINFLNSIIDDYIFPDKVVPKIENIKKIQEVFLDVMNKELSRTPITFPVVTACFSVDKEKNILDDDFLTIIAEKDKDFGFINIYCGDTSVLSSCCFDKNELVLTKDTKRGVILQTFKELSDTPRREMSNLKLYNNGFWSSGKPVKIERNNRDMYEVNLEKGQKLVMTRDHEVITIEGNKKTDDLNTNDYLMMNTNILGKIDEQDREFTFEDGILIGAYLGDGSLYKRKTSDSYEVTFSLNKSKVLKLKKYIEKAIHKIVPEASLKEYNSKNNTVFLKVHSKEIYNHIKKWVYGSYSYEKELNLDVLQQSEEFRKGILEGFHKTDGHNEYNILYTSSKKLRNTIEVLINSLGGITNISEDDRRDEPIVIRGQHFKRNHIIYHIRYIFNRQKQVKDVLKYKFNSLYIKIKSIRKLEDYDEEFVYCVEMNDKEDHYFTLPNGVHVSNCRLRSKKDNPYFNSFGGASSTIGSLGVCTLNMPHIAYESKDKEVFLEKIKTEVETSARVNHAKRIFIKKGILDGFLPLYKHDFIQLGKQYSTTGLTGINEALEILGLDILTPEGQEYLEQVLKVINTECDKFQDKYDSPHNVEQVPSENSSVKLALKDKILGLNSKYTIYSNQFIPLTTNADMLDRINIQGKFDDLFSGGAICHVNIEDKLEDINKIKDVIKHSAKKGVIYFALNYTLNECENGHMTVGKGDKCNICGKKIINVFTRVVGFLTNVKNWNKVRREEEFPKRKWY